MQPTYYPPKFKETSFNCPLCGVYAKQDWCLTYYKSNGSFYALHDLFISICGHCSSFSIWSREAMIEPNVGGVPLPNKDLPEDVLQDYIEARSILNYSPRGASALLRLGIQKLCKHLGESGANINNDIKSLVAKGLPIMIQQSLDIVRVVGNESVHPGQIDMIDNQHTALTLFQLTNLIAEVMITQPNMVSQLYNSLPEDKLKQIQERDKKSNGTV